MILLGILLTVFGLSGNEMQAQKLDFSGLTHRVGLDVRPSFVAQDNPFFKGSFRPHQFPEAYLREASVVGKDEEVPDPRELL